jgi:hypothetical protein
MIGVAGRGGRGAGAPAVGVLVPHNPSESLEKWQTQDTGIMIFCHFINTPIIYTSYIPHIHITIFRIQVR